MKPNREVSLELFIVSAIGWFLNPLVIYWCWPVVVKGFDLPLPEHVGYWAFFCAVMIYRAWAHPYYKEIAWGLYKARQLEQPNPEDILAARKSVSV